MEGYIRYVVTTVETQIAAGKVKKLAGAIFKALTESYLLPAHEKLQQPQPAAAKSRNGAKTKFAKPGFSLAGMRKCLISALEDACGSLAFVATAPIGVVQ